TSCPRQSFCSLPKVTKMQPPMLSVMGQFGVSWQINITFDRNMEFKRTGLSSGIYLQGKKDSEEATSVFVMDYTSMTIDGPTLQIDTSGILNDRLRDFDLVITDTALRGKEFMPFNGMKMGDPNQLTISLKDTMDPVVEDFRPLNSARSVAL
ncbi:unnamed protein product, partial [Polarella glacialis]